MEGRHNQHQHHQHQLQQYVVVPQGAAVQQQQQQQLMSMEGGSDSRFPQWSMQETKEFLMIRAELDQTFMETKRNKLLWEVISTKMREKGFNRSADQCKCKWKNLVTRYKGCETMEPVDATRQQFPFYNEMQTIFTARMERMLWSEAQGAGGGGGGGGGCGSGLTRKKSTMSSDEDDDDNEESDGDRPKTTTLTTSTSTGTNTKKKKKAKVIDENKSSELREILGEFMRQQMQMDMQWRELYEAREEERRVREMEWMRKMEALETERVSMERRWREGEERRRMREEARAENRDALITALLNKLRREETSSGSHHHHQHLP